MIGGSPMTIKRFLKRMVILGSLAVLAIFDSICILLTLGIWSPRLELRLFGYFLHKGIQF